MELHKLGPNMTELEFPDGLRVLYSYGTPVAAYVVGRGCVKSDRFFSRTISKHLVQWPNGAAATARPHAEILRIAGGR